MRCDVLRNLLAPRTNRANGDYIRGLAIVWEALYPPSCMHSLRGEVILEIRQVGLYDLVTPRMSPTSLLKLGQPC